MAAAPANRGRMLEGLPPHRPTRILRLATSEAAARQMTFLLGEVLDPSETAVASFEVEGEQGAAPVWLLEAYFEREPDEEAIRDLIRPIVGDGADAATFDTVTPKDWVKASLEGLKPVRAGRILVHGAHDREHVRPNDIAIEIEAALAFGTGHHGTTKGCLLALMDELRRRRSSKVLDVGTGTGILAFAAAKSLHLKVVAGDIDPVAVTVARENARRNGILPWVELYAAPGLQHAAARGRFDIVVANILARPLMRLAPSIGRAVAPGGTLILSGLIARDVAGVLSAYRAQGLSLKRRSDLEGWATLVLRRGGAAPRRRRPYSPRSAL